MKKNDKKQSYQELKQSLDEILDKLQQEDTALDEAVELHAKGQAILQQLDDYLQHVADTNEIKIKKVG